MFEDFWSACSSARMTAESSARWFVGRGVGSSRLCHIVRSPDLPTTTQTAAPKTFLVRVQDVSKYVQENS